MTQFEIKIIIDGQEPETLKGYQLKEIEDAEKLSDLIFQTLFDCDFIESMEELTNKEIERLEDIAWQDKDKLVSWFLEFGEYKKEDLESKTLAELQTMANSTGITSDFFINYR